MHPLFPILFFMVWAMLMGSFLYFSWHVAPSALRRWAAEHDYQIIERKKAGIFDWFFCAKGSGHWVYRIVVLDNTGETRRGLARIGEAYWPCLSSSRCPVEVRWDSLDKAGHFGVLSYAGSKVGSLLQSQAVTRRTVLCFGAADLFVAILVLAFELVCLFAIAVGVDEIWQGALGLNRYFGRVPAPDRLSDTRLFVAQGLGFFALYLPALVTLTAGGIGLLLRKPWAYTAHLAGSALVAVTCIGVLYTIPALLIALQPEFKAYVCGKENLEPASDPLREL